MPILKNYDFHFSFDLDTDSILKQINKLKKKSLFIFLCCFPFCFPDVLPFCGPRCATPSLGRSPRACFSANARARFKRARALAENDSLHWDHRPREAQRGVTTGRHNGRTTTGKSCKMRKSCFCNIVKC